MTRTGDNGGGPAIETDGLTKRFGDPRSGRVAVDGVSMTVRRGEVYGFLGPNGAGKTTTMRMLLGLARATSGTARVLGRRPGDPHLAGRVGFLVEAPGFYPQLTGRDNLKVLARHRGLPDSAVDPALELVDLAGRGGDRFRSYSLGMKQRLGVAAALLGGPELLVLDEPTNGLDPVGMADMRALVVALSRSGQTVVLSSHLLTEIQEVSDRVGVIVGGRLVREGTVGEMRGAAVVRLRGGPDQRAAAVCRELLGAARVHEVATDAGSVDLDLTGAEVPDLVRALVARDVDVLGVGAVERTLEEAFLELTATTGRPTTHQIPQQVKEEVR